MAETKPMTRDEILALDGRELDAAVGQIMFGWEPVPDGTVPGLRGIGWYKHAHEPGAYVCGFDEYSSDRNAARLVLAEVERRGDEYAMVRVLRVVEPSLPDVGLEYGEIQVWQVLRLTPKQLCQAALLAVCEGKE